MAIPGRSGRNEGDCPGASTTCGPRFRPRAAWCTWGRHRDLADARRRNDGRATSPTPVSRSGGRRMRLCRARRDVKGGSPTPRSVIMWPGT
uniref:Uncharacterized protein n=1 Tax=Ixodes ricinus TaxID=34613 RepID=A0A6B0U3T7_IXORI